ncbi:hypothetical protein LguiA_002501 [Lonicera macranthoides]
MNKRKNIGAPLILSSSMRRLRLNMERKIEKELKELFSYTQLELWLPKFFS